MRLRHDLTHAMRKRSAHGCDNKLRGKTEGCILRATGESGWKRGNHRMSRWILLFAAGLAISVRSAQAHHSIAGVYDTSQQVSIEGVVMQFHFVNPHPFLTVEVRGDGGAQQWRLEMDNRRELVDVGMTEETLKPGDKVVVKGNPVREKSQGLYIRKLERPSDGFQYEQVGSSPQVRTTR